MELIPGSILKDRYEIREQLGKGGMGAVYLAYDQALDQLVAVKTNLVSSEESRKQFETEARLLAKLRHPNLPLVFDHFIEGEMQVLVMDYIEGENLNDRLKAQGPQPVYKVLEWAQQIGDALNYLHSQDPPVIHRDVKPANLKLTPDGKVILVDFGIAKANTGETSVGARGYSPGYAPSEQYSNAITGPYSDQYSLAATLYALLTGGPPPESVDMMLGHQTLLSTRSFSRDIPIHVDNAIQRAMATNPEDRFPSITDFIRSLTVPSEAAPPTQRLEAPPKKNNRSCLLIGGLVILAFVVVTAVGAAAFSFLRSRGTPAAVAQQPSVTSAEVVVIDSTDTPTPLPPTETPTALPTATETLVPTATLSPTPEPTPLGYGGKIAFISDRDGSSFDQIFLMDSDGSNVEQLTFDETDKSYPMWSPDGTRLLYVADGGFGPYNNRYNLDIWVMNADGSDPVNLTQYQGNDDDPIWSPDGSRILFVTERFGGAKQLMTMNADGSDQTKLSDEFEEYNPTFSPDGQQIIFTGTFFYTLNVRYTAEETPEDTVPPKEYGFTELWDIRWSETDRIGKGMMPAWSPDGSYIAFIRTTGNNRHVYLVDVESKGATVVRLFDQGLNFDPAWSPDSHWIVFTSTKDGNEELYIMDFGGRFVTNLTDNPANDRQANWQPIP